MSPDLILNLCHLFYLVLRKESSITGRRVAPISIRSWFKNHQPLLLLIGTTGSNQQTKPSGGVANKKDMVVVFQMNSVSSEFGTRFPCDRSCGADNKKITNLKLSLWFPSSSFLSIQGRNLIIAIICVYTFLLPGIIKTLKSSCLGVNWESGWEIWCGHSHTKKAHSPSFSLRNIISELPMRDQVREWSPRRGVRRKR